jgi:NSS family neurotransmitter:Na+ symporter
MSLRSSAWLCGIGAWVLGVVTILSFNSWAFSFTFLGVEKKLGFFDVMQIATAQLLLPLTGILVAVFAGWVLKPAMLREVLHLRPAWIFYVWLWLLRLAVPVLLLIVLFKLPGLLA